MRKNILFLGTSGQAMLRGMIFNDSERLQRDRAIKILESASVNMDFATENSEAVIAAGKFLAEQNIVIGEST